MKKQIRSTFVDLTAIDAPSKNERAISTYVTGRLERFGLEVSKDKKGNVLGYLAGEGEPILLNAHLDRVLPGKGHTPVIDGDVVKSDGTSNLGSDDTAGLTIILEALSKVKTEKITHPPLVVAFTVEEEIGLWGAKALDLTRYQVQRGIVYDNVFEAGTVVSRGAAYVAVDLEIKGKAIHPGKDLSIGINVIEIFRKAKFPIGETDNGQTRINMGTLNSGAARNAVPDKLTAQSEIRSFLDEPALTQTVHQFQRSFTQAAENAGGTVTFTTKKLAVAYSVDPEEPLLKAYRKVVEKRGGKFEMKKTFIASDANALRGERGLQVFTVSTGVFNEHSTEETVRLSDMELVANDLVNLLELLGSEMTLNGFAEPSTKSRARKNDVSTIKSTIYPTNLYSSL